MTAGRAPVGLVATPTRARTEEGIPWSVPTAAQRAGAEAIARRKAKDYQLKSRLQVNGNGG